MTPVVVPIRKRDSSVATPLYATALAAGADLFADIETPVEIGPGAVAMVATGVFLEIPEGFEVQVRPRSGLAAKFGVTVLNAPGTIDADYRGEIKVILINHGKEPFTVEPKMRIAQMVLCRVERALFCEVAVLGASQRAEGGFGHTGL